MLIVVTCLAMITTAAADYKAEFREGIAAINQKQWPRAILKLKAAIAEQSIETGEPIISAGGVRDYYMPHALLGLALYYSSKDGCAAAMAAWEVSRGQGSSWLKLPRGAEITKAWTTCQAQIRLAAESKKPPSSGGDEAAAARLRAALQRAETAISAAERAQEQAAELAKNPSLQSQWQNNSQLGASEARAQTLLASARAALAESRSKSDLTAAAQAEERAELAKDTFDKVRDAANVELTRPAPVAIQVEPGLTRLPTSGGGVGPPVDPGGRSGKPEDPKTPSKAAATPDPPAGTKGAKPEDVAKPLTSPPAPSQPVVSPALRSAAGQFFQARYAEAAASLADARFERTQEQLQAELFQAAAHYALYATSGERAKERRIVAEQHVRACRQIRPDFEPDRQFFSPRFIEFYRGVTPQ